LNGKGKQTIENKNRLGIAPNQIVQRATKKHTRARFVATWTNNYKGGGRQISPKLFGWLVSRFA
jgi:hypothetical protein